MAIHATTKEDLVIFRKAPDFEDTKMTGIRSIINRFRIIAKSLTLMESR